MRLIIIITVVLYYASFIRAENVSLSGIVVKAGKGTGIAGVTVGLSKLTDESTATGSNGSFVIGGTASTLVPHRQTASFQLKLNGNTLIFSPMGHNTDGRVDIFSCNGITVISYTLNRGHQSVPELKLPDLSNGIYFIRITIKGQSLARTLVALNNGLFLTDNNSHAYVNEHGNHIKQATVAIVDTLIASKNGYAVKKLPIDSYVKENILIEMDTAEEINKKCTRDALEALADSYIEAQKAGDPSKMSLAPQVKYLQNMKVITAQKCICNTALPVAFHRHFLDVDSCRTFTEVIVTEGGHPYVIGTRLKADNGSISEIHSMVTDKNDWLFDANKYLTTCKKEDWEVVPVEARMDRQTLIDGCNAYFNFVFDWENDSINPPWGNPCNRLEGGGARTSPTCDVGATGNSVKTTHRSFVVDVDKNAINIFCYFGFGPDSHIFRFVDKKYRFVHTLTACGDSVGSGKACWDVSPGSGTGKGFGE